MSRASEIEKEAKNKYPYIKGLPQTVAHQEIFIDGAKWADETMIDKACRWMKDEISNYVSYDGEIDKELITDFRKAMEG